MTCPKLETGLGTVMTLRAELTTQGGRQTGELELQSLRCPSGMGKDTMKASKGVTKLALRWNKNVYK